MKKEGFPFSQVAAISGSGQQHGSVYWNQGSQSVLKNLNSSSTLKNQLTKAFRVPDSPIWMDSSTTEQCLALEKAMGGPQAVASLTGSRAYERFTGNQIAKIAKHDPKAYNETERISLISSAMCSVLLGDYAPIDTSDGCGMNLVDIKSLTWSNAILAHVGANLANKLGTKVVPSHQVVGNISSYFRDVYGIPSSCKVVAWSGDNPNSVAGTGLRSPGDIAVSLGTSDTMFGITASPTPGIEGHIFANPVDPKSYMAMLCYKNGSLTRERVRNESANKSWDAFDTVLNTTTKPGNDGHIGFYIDSPEITPALKAGVRRFSPSGSSYKRVSSFSNPAHDVRAVVEGQFMSMRVHGESVGLTSPKRVIATGGASGNASIVQVLADVFGAPVYVASQTDTASLGAAYRALHGYTCDTQGKFVPFEAVTGEAIGSSLRLAASPRSDAHAAYTALLPAYKKCEAEVLAE